MPSPPSHRLFRQQQRAKRQSNQREVHPRMKDDCPSPYACGEQKYDGRDKTIGGRLETLLDQRFDALKQRFEDMEMNFALGCIARFQQDQHGNGQGNDGNIRKMRAHGAP